MSPKNAAFGPGVAVFVGLGVLVGRRVGRGVGVSVGVTVLVGLRVGLGVTVSVGVLQAEMINFVPDLPASKVTAYNTIGMGNGMKIFLRFFGVALGLLLRSGFEILERLEVGQKELGVHDIEVLNRIERSLSLDPARIIDRWKELAAGWGERVRVEMGEERAWRPEDETFAGSMADFVAE